jgi:enoyl-CoA hydratase
MVLTQYTDGFVTVLTLNRPEQRNALSMELIAALSAALNAAKADPSVRAVILTGAGGRAFCAGMDLRAFADAQDSGGFTYDPEQTGGFAEFTRGEFPKPIVAAVNASAVAGGFELVLNCDLVVASGQARFGLPEVKRGLFPAGGGFALPARIPLAVALELGLTGEYIDAGRALALGLVNRVVAPEAVVPTAMELAGQIAANGPLAVALTKRVMRTVTQAGVREAYAEAEAGRASVFASKDAIEGVRAFAERRTPQWTGA